MFTVVGIVICLKGSDSTHMMIDAACNCPPIRSQDYVKQYYLRYSSKIRDVSLHESYISSRIGLRTASCHSKSVLQHTFTVSTLFSLSRMPD